MKSLSSFKEIRKRGNSNFPFEKYDIISDNSRQFATNHWHDEIEIIYITNGSINLTINHNKFTGKPGDIFIVNSGEMHEIYGCNTPLKYTAFVFDFDMLSFRKDDFAQQNYIDPVLSGKIQFFNNVKNSEKAFKLLEYINEINTQKNTCYSLFTKAILMQFFALLIEQNQVTFIHEDSVNDEKKQLLKKIVIYINENYTEQITLKEISGNFNMSHKYFCRFFKNNFNKTFIEYLNDVRIENSTRLLSENNITVTEAAISCGFSNMSYFTRIFKKKTGYTPSQYKNKNCKEVKSSENMK